VVSYPRKIRVVGGIFSAALVIMVIIGWAALPAHLRAQFSAFQLITLLAVLVALIGVIGLVACSTVRADAGGVRVRNGLRVHQLGWDQVHRVVYRSGDPWATLLIGDPDDPHRVVLLGVQRSDGERTDRVVTGLRRLRNESRADR
jgi:hypothetical protein